MKRVFNYLMVICLFSFIFIINANAECSYQERKDLLNQAKNVEIWYEINTKKVNEEIINSDTGVKENKELEKKYITLNIINITEDIFIKIYTLKGDSEAFYINESLLNNGIYSFDNQNINDIEKYYFEFYSNRENCKGSKITTKTLIKPKYNYLHDLEICKNDNTFNLDYCKEFVTEDFNQNEAMSKLMKLVNNSSEQPVDNESNIFLDYWYFFVLFILLVIIIVFVLLKRRRKNYEI